MGGKVFVWKPACGRQRRLLWTDPLLCGVVARLQGKVPGDLPLSCVIQGDVAFDDDISVSLLEVDLGDSTSARAA